MRIGCGYDVHRLQEGRKLILCGVEIPFHKGLLGHSDADVAIHSVIDALLGAVALGDIGAWFPDDDLAYKDSDSRLLLRKVWNTVKDKGWQLGNLDCTIVLQKPKLAPHIFQMRQNLAADLETALPNISVKATTEEGLGFTGREEGIAANSVVLLMPQIQT